MSKKPVHCNKIRGLLFDCNASGCCSLANRSSSLTTSRKKQGKIVLCDSYPNIYTRLIEYRKRTMLATVCKYVVGLFLLSSYKSLPGAYFVRFYYSPIKYALLPVFTGYDTKNIKTLQSDKFGVFRANKYTTYASPFECDFYFHKSNSTYFAELDVNRGELLCKIFQKLFLTSKHYPFIPVANVFMNFLKEIKPFEKYDISSHIFCWDQKWLYIMSRFTKKNGKTLFSIAITKYVLKNGRKTINPRDAMKACGIYNEEVEKISQENLVLLTEKSGFHDTTALDNVEHNYGYI